MKQETCRTFSRGCPLNVYEVIVVDGRSVDDPIAVASITARRPGSAADSAGEGERLACGFEAATGDVIAMVDADRSADPSEIPKFVHALLGGADFRKGNKVRPRRRQQ